MNHKENLYYSLGHLAYAVAKADGEVQREEREIVNEIVSSEIKKITPEINISEIIFSILQEQKETLETTIKRAEEELELSKDHITDDVKKDFLDILYKVAAAFPPIERAEETVINRAKEILDRY